MNMRDGLIRRWQKILLIVVCIVVALVIGYGYGRNTVETEMKTLVDNIYGGRYYVDVAYAGVGGQASSITLSASGFRFPMRNSEGDSYVKEAMPFIEQRDAPYDISNFALTDSQSNSGFDFTFVGCLSPDNVFVQRWPRNQQGTTGTVTNGEIVDFEIAAPPAKYHASSFEPGYIYSIYASWGPYYGEYSFLVSTQESDRAYWKLETNSEYEEDGSPGNASFEGTVFRYAGQDYDISTRIKSVNSILSVIPVGQKFVIECHIGPKNGAYCIFDTENESFDEDIIGNHLIWHSDDITTSVYSFWSEIHTYDGSIIKKYDLEEDAFIYDLAFSDNYKMWLSL